MLKNICKGCFCLVTNNNVNLLATAGLSLCTVGSLLLAMLVQQIYIRIVPFVIKACNLVFKDKIT